jgi:hypothetical protein
LKAARDNLTLRLYTKGKPRLDGNEAFLPFGFLQICLFVNRRSKVAIY